MTVIEDFENLYLFQENLNNYLKRNTQLLNSVTADLIDIDFLEEIKNVVNSGSAGVYFGKTLRDMKICVQDDGGLRNHEIFLEYKASRKLIVSNAKLPHSPVLNSEYRSLEDLLEAVRTYIKDLERYFYELEHLDKNCTVMEPVNASFKDDYRRILLDDRTWLHVEVTPEGLATNIHLVGPSVHWHNKLQSGLLVWDHDKDIVHNVMTVFELSSFPQLTTHGTQADPGDKAVDALICGICLCDELPEVSGVPQPLCQNAICGVYYHRNCLYQWLVACAGSRPPAFGVANGTCPTCLQPITCSENQN